MIESMELTEQAQESDPADAHVTLIQRKLSQFADELTGGQSLEVFVPLTDGTQIRATSFGSDNPDMVKVVGLDLNGNDVNVLLHKTALQVVMKKISGGPEIDPQAVFKSTLRSAVQEATLDAVA